MKKLSILLVLLVSLSFVATAQINFGFKGGLNMANFSGDVEDNKMRIAYQAGVVANLDLADAISFQPGLMLASKGAKAESSFMGMDFSSTVRYNYLEVPLNLAYGIDMGPGQIQIIAGPYASFGIGGTVESEVAGETDEADVQFVGDATDVDEGNYPAKNLDFGANLGLGFKTGSLQIQALYGLGLANTIPPVDGADPEDEVKNSVIQLSVSYFLQ